MARSIARSTSRATCCELVELLEMMISITSHDSIACSICSGQGTGPRMSSGAIQQSKPLLARWARTSSARAWSRFS